MNIGLDVRLLGNRHGGIGRYSFELAKQLLLHDNKNTYTLFFNTADADEADIAFFSQFHNAVLVRTTIRHYSWAEQMRLPSLLDAQKLDLVHFPNFNVPLLYKKPFVTTIHDVVHHKISGAKKSRWLSFYAYKKVIQHAAWNSRHIVTVSQFSKQDIAEVLRVPLEKISVTYEGTNLPMDVSEEYSQEIKKQFLLTKPYFLFVGVLERKKNLAALTAAFDQFLKQYNIDIDLVVVGKTDKHYPDIARQAMNINHSANLVFTGYVSDLQLSALYKNAFAYVSASLHEGFGLPGVEAMKFGLPLLVSNLPVYNEIYDNAAVYFDPKRQEDIAEKMYLLVRDSLFSRQLGKNSLERSKLFSWNKCAEDTLRIYEAAVSELK